jgi:hypothetical protein
MRTCFVEYVIARCEGESPGWTYVQCEIIIAYFDKFWHFNLRVRAACIDERLFELRLNRLCKYVASTGGLESGHKHWDSIMMHGLQNKVRLSFFTLI